MVFNEILFPLSVEDINYDSKPNELNEDDCGYIERSSQNLALKTGMRHAQKFLSALNRVVDQTKESVQLQVPSDVLSIHDKAKKDCEYDVDMIQSLQLQANAWVEILTKAIGDTHEVQLKQISGHKSTLPVEEVNFWHRRHALLSDLQSQLDNEIIVRSITILRNSDSPIVSSFENVMNTLLAVALEASDCARFLSTLDRHLQLLATVSVPAIEEVLPSMFDSLKAIWTLSRYYNREDHMRPFMEKISHHLFERATHRIILKNVFAVHLEIGINILTESKSLLNAWEECYIKTKAVIESEGLSRRKWEFDKARFFRRTRYAISVIDNVIDVLRTIMQFRRFLGPELIAVTGEDACYKSLQSSVESLQEIFIKMYHLTFLIQLCKKIGNRKSMNFRAA